jgi:hypothetical protein
LEGNAMDEATIEKIVNDKVKFNGYGFDPLTILAIITAAIQIYKLLKECKAAQWVLKGAARRKGLAYRYFVQRNFLDKLKELNVPEADAEAILEELRTAYVNS